MIHIFSGCQAICSLPGMMCKACGQACQQLNCSWLKTGCEFCGKGCTHFMERPLSTYVLIMVLLCFAQFHACYVAITEETGSDGCVFPEDASLDFASWVYAMIGFALVNLIFAPYFQYKVWADIQE